MHQLKFDKLSSFGNGVVNTVNREWSNSNREQREQQRESESARECSFLPSLAGVPLTQYVTTARRQSPECSALTASSVPSMPLKRCVM